MISNVEFLGVNKLQLRTLHYTRVLRPKFSIYKGRFSPNFIQLTFTPISKARVRGSPKETPDLDFLLLSTRHQDLVPILKTDAFLTNLISCNPDLKSDFLPLSGSRSDRHPVRHLCSRSTDY